MLTLPVETWLRFLIWLVLGFVVYFLYGYRSSRLAGYPGDPQDGRLPSMTGT